MRSELIINGKERLEASVPGAAAVEAEYQLIGVELEVLMSRAVVDF